MCDKRGVQVLSARVVRAFEGRTSFGLFVAYVASERGYPWVYLGTWQGWLEIKEGLCNHRKQARLEDDSRRQKVG